MADPDTTPPTGAHVAGAPDDPATPATPATPAANPGQAPAQPPVPTEREDRERVAADEERLEHLDEVIADAHATRAEQQRRWQSGLLPQAEGDEGEGNASLMRG